MSIVVTTAPTARPVSLAELKGHLRILHNEEDADLDFAIDSAIEQAQIDVRQKFIRQSVTWKLDFAFPRGFIVPAGPLIDVTSITYVDDAGADQTLAADQYVVDASHDPGRIYPAYDVTWPTTRAIQNAVTVVYRAGHGTAAADVPQQIRRAILMLAAYYFENREAYAAGTLNEVPMGYSAMLHPYRNWSFGA